MKGQAPYQIEFRWVYRPPIPAGLDPAAREAMVAQRLEEIFDEIHLPAQDDLGDAARARCSPEPRWSRTSTCPTRDAAAAQVQMTVLGLDR
jgi:hypothetical protein